MEKILNRGSTKLTISEFYDNYNAIPTKYNFNANYQRNSGIWADDKRSFLIDSILKNYPIPAIYLKPVIDNKTGKTTYDVIDGKQRLLTIISFIKSEIPLTAYFDEDSFFDDGSSQIAKEISGLLFNQIQADEKFQDYVKRFWKYELVVEYLYEDNEEYIRNAFDRLNRNGEPLTAQELRNAKFCDSYLLYRIKEIKKNFLWNNQLSKLDVARMEDDEFVSELLFLIAENKIMDSDSQKIDSLYTKYTALTNQEIDAFVEGFILVSEFIKSLNLPYERYKRLSWTTHMYAIFSFGWYCINNDIATTSVQEKINHMYENYMSKNPITDSYLIQYKSSASSSTKSEIQRKRRLDAMINYCTL